MWCVICFVTPHTIWFINLAILSRDTGIQATALF